MSSNTPKQKKNNTVQIKCGFKPKSRVINQEHFLKQCNKFLKSRGLEGDTEVTIETGTATPKPNVK